MGRDLRIEWEMGMLVREWDGMGTRNPFPLISSPYSSRSEPGILPRTINHVLFLLAAHHSEGQGRDPDMFKA